VQPPGREKRRAEPPVTSAPEMGRQLAPEIIDLVRPPYALFGHSAGALSAFEVSREIRRLGGALPVHLFVAGRRAPAQYYEYRHVVNFDETGRSGPDARPGQFAER